MISFSYIVLGLLWSARKLQADSILTSTQRVTTVTEVEQIVASYSVLLVWPNPDATTEAAKPDNQAVGPTPDKEKSNTSTTIINQRQKVATLVFKVNNRPTSTSSTISTTTTSPTTETPFDLTAPPEIEHGFSTSTSTSTILSVSNDIAPPSASPSATSASMVATTVQKLSSSRPETVENSESESPLPLEHAEPVSPTSGNVTTAINDVAPTPASLLLPGESRSNARRPMVPTVSSQPKSPAGKLVTRIKITTTSRALRTSTAFFTWPKKGFATAQTATRKPQWKGFRNTTMRGFQIVPHVVSPAPASTKFSNRGRTQSQHTHRESTKNQPPFFRSWPKKEGTEGPKFIRRSTKPSTNQRKRKTTPSTVPTTAEELQSQEQDDYEDYGPEDYYSETSPIMNSFLSNPIRAAWTDLPLQQRIQWFEEKAARNKAKAGRAKQELG